ncbi:hypothetical protein NPA11_01500 [Mycoplasma sp. 1578d]|uniref:hypothetical protein n=1 Tax=Mycoplasma sp. 1578d TaxID=2967299 RepID=UPI00211C7F83|nr:hypothetical protein [Mycoplasma sp. 1578d]UUM20084.1 hypothetical protein NPA11_01500 [Mycoplasma sp. 1578d]
MKKSKKALASLAISVGITGGAALVSAGVLLSLHNQYKVKPTQTYFFTELKNQVTKTTNALKALSPEQVQNEQIKNLKNEIDYANQLLANEKSSIALMLQQRNKLKQETPKALLSVVNDEQEAKNLVEQYYSLVKDVDYQSIVNNSKDKVIQELSSPTNKKQALNAFYEMIDPLIAQQNDFSFELETKIWTNHEQLIKNSSTQFSAQEKSALLSTIEQILNLLHQPQYSRDAVVTYEKVFDEMVDKLSQNKEKENKSLNNFLENVIRVRSEVNDLKIDDSLRANFLERIDNFKNIALSDSPSLALTKSEEIVFLNDLVNNQLSTLIQESPDIDKLRQTLSQNLANLKSTQFIPAVHDLVQMHIEKISANPTDTQVDLLNSIAQVNDLSSTVKNIEKLIDTINIETNKYLNEKNLAQADVQAFDKQLDTIVKSNFENINDYLTKLNQLHNNIYDNVLLGSVFKNSLKKLNDQILESIDKGFDVDKNALSQMLLTVQNILNSNPSIKDLNDTLRVQSNLLRETNRKELKNWYDSAVLILDDTTNDIDGKIKDKLKFLNSQAIKLIPQDSTAIREELQILIRQYREEIAKSHISEGLQKTLLQYSRTKDDLFGVFGATDGKINSPFGAKLLEQAQELAKQAKIIAQNPGLTQAQKEERFVQIQKQLIQLGENAQKFKELEAQVALGEETIASSNGRKAEQVYLEKETLAINKIKNKILEALNNGSSANDLDDLKDQMTQAIKDYKDKQAEYQGGQALKDYFKQINDAFAPYSLGGAPTTMQKKLLDKLSEYQKQLASTTLTPGQRDVLNEQVLKLMEVVQSAKDLEVKNNDLKSLVNNTQNNNYGSFKPTTQFTNATNLTNEVDTYLVDLFNPDFDKGKIATFVQRLTTQNSELELAISIALLQKTNATIQANKITDTNLLNTSPYSDINNSIESINTQVNQLLNTQDKTQAQIDGLESSIKHYSRLALALKASADKLKDLNDQTNPIAYEALKKSIINKPSSGTPNEPANSLIVFGDTPSTIDFKTRILTSELDKANIRVQAENNIKLLEAVYTQAQRNHAIFDDAVSVFDAKVADYKKQVEQFYASIVNLTTLRDEIDSYTNREKSIRDAIQAAWDKAILQKTTLQNDYNKLKMADGITTITHTTKVFTDFGTLVNATDQSGKKTTLTQTLLDKLQELPLAYAKDSFIHTADQINTKLDPFATYSSDITTPYSNDWKTIITNWKNALKDTVNTYNDASDLVKIKRDYQKISALNSLIAQFKTIFDYLDNTSKSDTTKKNVQVLTTQRPNNTLFTKLNDKNTYQNLSTTDFYNKTPQNILTLRNEFRNFYLDNVSIEDAKASQITKIKDYKKNVDDKIDAITNIDPQLKTQIDNKLQDLLTQTNGVQQKDQLITIDDELSKIQFKEENLKQLAIKTQNAKTLIQNNNSVPKNEIGKKSIITSIQNIYTNYQNDYLMLDALEMINKDNQLEEKIALFSKFNQVYTQVQTEKNNLTIQYAEGTGAQGTAQAGLTKMQGYYDHLTQQLNTSSITQSLIYTVEHNLSTLQKLIQVQGDKLTIQAQVLSDTDYNNYTYKTGTAPANYGFDTDAKKLADAILKSIPDNSKTDTQIETELNPNLVNEFQQAYDLYLARKNALDFLYKDGQVVAQNGIKTKEVAQLKNGNNVQSKYTKLKEKADDFFHKQAQAIQNATDKATIDSSTLQAVEFDVFFDKYKKIADLVDLGTQAKNTINAAGTPISSDTNVTNSITKLDDEITRSEGYYYTSKNDQELDRAIFLLEAYTARLKLAQATAQKHQELNNFNTISTNGEFLSTNAKTPLSNIINQPFTDLANDPNLETKENYDKLLEKYITGSSNTSYSIAFVDSKILQSSIQKGQEYLTSYKAKIAQNQDYETPEIKNLYNELEAKITEATNALEKNQHDEPEKIRLAHEIYNSNNGALDKILNAEREKAKKAYALHLSLDKFITNHFAGSNTSPKMQDYKTIALDPLETIDISTAVKLEQFNTNLTNAQDKYQDQRVDLFKWEANRYKSYKEKFDQFYNLLNNNQTNGANKNFILEVTGINQGELDNYNNTINNPPTSDALHTDAKNNVDRLNQNNADIKNWIKTQTQNTAIEQISTVADEIFNYYSNLISIKSIPSILIKFTNLNKIKEELMDSANIENVRKSLKTTHSETNILSNRINAFINEMGNATNNVQTTIRAEVNESNDSFSNGTPANISAARTTYFNNYQTIVTALAKAKDKLLELVFGTGASDQDTLQKVLAKFIDGATNFDGRANLANFLKYIASQTQASPNIAANQDKFTVVKNEYRKISDPSKQSETALNNLQKTTASDIDIFGAITKGFDLALKLFDWTTDPKNTDLFFDFLTETVDGTFNYANIVAKASTTLEKFRDIITGNTLNEENLTIDGTAYKGKKLNGQIDANGNGLLGNLFNQFNILKGNDKDYFNRDNVDVYLIKPTNQNNAQYVTSRLTPDPKKKKGFVNLYFKFRKPNNVTDTTSAFSNVDTFGVKFDNVGIEFNTIDFLTLNKENIRNASALDQTLFTAEEAGWNNLEAPSRILSAFNKYSLVKAIGDNTTFYSEDWTKKIDEKLTGDPNQLTNSSPSFRIKLNMKNQFRGYIQNFNDRNFQIFWKTLNPNFVSDTGIQYQNSPDYISELISSADQTNYKWAQTHQYVYNPQKDAGKNLLFLPIVIGVPVFNTHSRNGDPFSIMVLTWQILMRFDKNPTSNSQNISLGSENVLKRVFFVQRTNNGRSGNAPTVTSEGFINYVMSKIKVRDLEDLSFKDLRSSRLWNADPYVEVNDKDSGLGGIGTDEFYNAIGPNGKFEVKIKLH